VGGATSYKSLQVEEDTFKNMIAEHILYVVRIMFDSDKKKWFYTVSKDAVRVFTSAEFDTVTECYEQAKGKWE